MSLLEAKSVTVRFQGHDTAGRRCLWAAVDGVSLSVAEGERVGIIGESGSGKTTLGKALLGLESLAGGEVLFRGQSISAMGRAAHESFRRGAQMIFQDPMGSLNPRMTVGAAIEEVISVHRLVPKIERKNRVRELLHQVGLDSDYAGRCPHEFSGGQRQRIGIARGLALDPALLIADEPVSALDVSVQAQILNLIRDLSVQRGMALLLVAHDLAVVNYVCQRVLIMYKGRVVEEGLTADVFGTPRHPYTQLLKSAVPDPDDFGVESAALRQFEMSNSANLSNFRGCPFAPRCHCATQSCFTEYPELKKLSTNHRAACRFV
jgi:peptide/nickel transport system ATP-binding protein